MDSIVENSLFLYLPVFLIEFYYCIQDIKSIFLFAMHHLISNQDVYKRQVPFNMAAEVGTQKVINDHSTLGLVITTDGSISDIPRDEYEEAEELVISCLLYASGSRGQQSRHHRP